MATSVQVLRSLTRTPARTILRLNALASLAGALLVLGGAGPLVEIGIPPSAILVTVALLIVNGVDALGFAVRRRLTRAHVLAFAVIDTVGAAASLAFVVGGPDALTFLGRAIAALAAATFAWFSMAEIRAAREL